LTFHNFFSYFTLLNGLLFNNTKYIIKMTRLAHICLAALALLVAITSAAPCNKEHGVGEHHRGGEEHHEMGHHGDHDDGWDGDDYEGEDAYDDNDEGDEGDEGDEWEHDGDCIDDCGNYDNGGDWPNHEGGDGDHNGSVHGGRVDGGAWPEHESGDGDHNGSYHGVEGGRGGRGGYDDDGSLIGVNAGYIGTGDINAQGVLNKAVNVPDLSINNIAESLKVL
jgi:hypothetical protein